MLHISAIRGFVFAVVAVALGYSFIASAQQNKALPTDPSGLLAIWKGPIAPASTRYLKKAIAEAEKKSAPVLILEIDTPGGLVTSMRDMISVILQSRVPVVGYVAPPGAHAASAGTYIIYATHLAAMAPGTNIGAATPIELGGFSPGLPSPSDNTDRLKSEKSIDKTPGERPEIDKLNGSPPSEPTAAENAGSAKAVNDAVAFIRSLAELRGRNADWAEAAVRGAASLSASEALKQNVINVVATDVPSLLEEIDGRNVVINGTPVTLHTHGMRLESFEPTVLIQLLALLTDPNIALMLILFGIYGLIFEIASPGTFGPGIAGSISLILGLYALNQLPIDYAGLALLLLGIALLIGEALAPTIVMGTGGLVAFIAGAFLLIDTDVPALRISWPVIAGLAALSFSVLTLLLAYVWKSQRREVVIGDKALAGAKAEVIDWSQGHGHVWLYGERWEARGGDHLKAGDAVIVDRMEDLTLVLRADER